MMKEQTRFCLSKNSQSSGELIKTPEILKNSFASAHAITKQHSKGMPNPLLGVIGTQGPYLHLFSHDILPCAKKKLLWQIGRSLSYRLFREMRHTQMTKQNYSITIVNASRLAPVSHLAS